MGYSGDIFHDVKQNTILKQYSIREDINYLEDYSAKFLFDNEIAIVKKLNEIKNPHVQVPKIISINIQKLSWKQQYFENIPFYSYLRKNANKTYFNPQLLTIFYNFGVYLGTLHEKNFISNKSKKNPTSSLPKSILHGDLSSHNVSFLRKKNALFIYDPGVSNESVYDDICKFISNLILLNPLLKVILSRKKINLLIIEFLRGYRKNISKFSIPTQTLKRELIKKLEKDSHIISQSFMYRTIKKVLDSENKRVVNAIKRGDYDEIFKNQ